MFIINLTYKKPIEIVDQHVETHRRYLDEGYAKNYLITSGPKNPRKGGIMLSQLKDADILMNFLKQDPFYIHGIADYELIEFSPVKFHPDFAKFV